MGTDQTQLGVCRPRLSGSICPSGTRAAPQWARALGVLQLPAEVDEDQRLHGQPSSDRLPTAAKPTQSPAHAGPGAGGIRGPAVRVPQDFYHVNPYRSTGLPVAIPRTATPPPAPPAGLGLAQPLPGRLHRPGLWLLVSGTVALVMSLPPADENFYFGQGHIRAIKTFAFSLPWVSISLLTLSLGSAGTASGGRPHPQSPPHHGCQPGHLRALCPPSARGLGGRTCSQAGECTLPHHPARR